MNNVSDMRARADEKRALRDLSTRAIVVSTDAAHLALSDEALDVASRNPAVARRLAALVRRSRAAQSAAIDAEYGAAPTSGAQMPSGATEDGDGPLTAAMETLDAGEFVRRVQVRRRMDALRGRRGKKRPQRRAARTVFDPTDDHLTADHTIAD